MKKKKFVLTTALYAIVLGFTMFITRILFNQPFGNLEGYLLIALIFATIAIVVIVPKKWNVIPGTLLSLSYGIYIVSQIIYYRGFSYYYRLSTALAFKNELGNSMDSAIELTRFSDFLLLAFILLVNIIALILMFIQPKRKLRFTHKCIVAGLCMIVTCISMYMYDNKLSKMSEVDPFEVYKSDYYLYTSVNSTAKFVKEFGPTTLLYRDFNTLLHSSNAASDISEIDDYIADKPLMETNEYSGIFKDKNLLIIQAESLVNAFIHPTLTPTLYKLKNEGMFFEGFNAPLLPGSTSDAEFLANIGIVPESEGYSSSFRFVKNEYPTTLPKLFKLNGYNAYAYHNNFGEFYNRSEFFPALGYDFYDSFRLGIETESVDSVTMDAMKWILLEDPKYMAFWITFSGHQPYSTPDYNAAIAQYKEEAMSVFPTLNIEYITILCKTMDLDRTIASYLENLNYAKQLDDTVIVIYGDHLIKGDYMYENNTDQISKLVGASSLTSEELLYWGSNPLIIYNSQQPPLINKTASSILDLSPTLYNLFGIDYDQSTVLGNDIFDPNYTGRFFTNVGYFQTNNFYYDEVNDIYRPVNNYPFKLAQNDIIEIKRVREISKMMLETDYFSKKEK